MQHDIEKCFKQLSQDARDFYVPHAIPVVFSITPLEFLRQVSSNVPLLIKGGVNHYPALYKWTPNFLRHCLGDKKVTVAVTPNGYADAIAKGPNGEEFFVEPEERQMKMCDFLDVLEDPEATPGVFYIQRQNSNLTSEFLELMNDIEGGIPFATEALNLEPSELNLWMGDGRAITSMHKDPFENLYCVISGHKKFILHPPTDRPWIPYGTYRRARYHEVVSGRFDIVQENKSVNFPSFNGEDTIPKCLCDVENCSGDCKEGSVVPWICIDPLNPNFKKFPLYKKCSTIEVIVEAGDILYLPSLWFHHVQQSHGCIALNYWYDMSFDVKWVYNQFTISLLPLLENTGEKKSETKEKPCDTSGHL